MERHKDFARYVEACSYPGTISPEAVTAHLREYVAALGIERQVVQLRRGWTLEDHPDLWRSMDALAADIAHRTKHNQSTHDAQAVIDAQAAQDAQAVMDAQAAREAVDARDTREARDAQAARTSLDAQSAQSALYARAALAAQAAQATMDAQAAMDARDTREARDAQDARVARVAHAAQVAKAARAAQEALAAQEAREARYAQTARVAQDALDALARWAMSRSSYWCSLELSWVASTWLGARTPNVMVWSGPLFEAFVSGAWVLVWTETTLYWVGKPTVYTDADRRPHREGGPALVSDLEDLWLLHGVLVTQQIVERPNTITAVQVAAETDMEVQRIMIERMGPGKYLSECGAKLVDMDALTLEGSAPRALMEDQRGEKWLVGTDGSTARVYHMSVPREARTCREAHEMICGFDESRLIAEC